MNDNNPSPLVPQGSLLEQKAKGKASLPVAFFIFLALHAVVLGGFLMVGCRPDDAKKGELASNTKTNEPAASDLGPLNTNLGGLYPVPTNPVTAATGTVTNPATTYSNTAPVTGFTTPGGGLGTGASPVADTTSLSTPVTTGSASEYKIEKGDTLAVIAKKHGVSLSALQKANPGVVSSKLKVGQKLQIPAPSEKSSTASTTAKPVSDTAGTTTSTATGETTSYTVKPGDTLTKVAKSHGTTAKAVRTANNLKTDRINVGQKLKLPVAKSAAVVPDAGTNPVAGTARQ